MQICQGTAMPLQVIVNPEALVVLVQYPKLPEEWQVFTRILHRMI